MGNVRVVKVSVVSVTGGVVTKWMQYVKIVKTTTNNITFIVRKPIVRE
jgi:hypothetical protein